MNLRSFKTFCDINNECEVSVASKQGSKFKGRSDIAKEYSVKDEIWDHKLCKERGRSR